MAERIDARDGAGDARERRDLPREQDDVVVHPDGSSAQRSTQDGRLTQGDVGNAPLVQGTDPLSDTAIDRRGAGGRGGRVTPRLVIFGIVALVVLCFLISDVAHGAWGKAVLGAVVLLICGSAIARETRGPRP